MCPRRRALQRLLSSLHHPKIMAVAAAPAVPVALAAANVVAVAR